MLFEAALETLQQSALQLHIYVALTHYGASTAFEMDGAHRSCRPAAEKFRSSKAVVTGALRYRRAIVHTVGKSFGCAQACFQNAHGLRLQLSVAIV